MNFLAVWPPVESVMPLRAQPAWDCGLNLARAGCIDAAREAAEMEAAGNRSRAVMGVFAGIGEDVADRGCHDRLADEAPAGVVQEARAEIGDPLHVTGLPRLLVDVAAAGDDHLDVVGDRAISAEGGQCRAFGQREMWVTERDQIDSGIRRVV